jgi:hypothetical protein
MATFHVSWPTAHTVGQQADRPPFEAGDKLRGTLARGLQSGGLVGDRCARERFLGAVIHAAPGADRARIEQERLHLPTPASTRRVA